LCVAIAACNKQLLAHFDCWAATSRRALALGSRPGLHGNF